MLCQIELLAYVELAVSQPLLGLAMHGMFAASRAEFVKFNTPRIITSIFLRGVISFLALRTRQGDHRANIFFRGHNFPLLAAGCTRSLSIKQ